MVGCLSSFGGGDGSFPAQGAYRLALLVAHVGENSSPNCFLPQISSVGIGNIVREKLFRLLVFEKIPW